MADPRPEEGIVQEAERFLGGDYTPDGRLLPVVRGLLTEIAALRAQLDARDREIGDVWIGYKLRAEAAEAQLAAWKQWAKVVAAASAIALPTPPEEGPQP